MSDHSIEYRRHAYLDALLTDSEELSTNEAPSQHPTEVEPHSSAYLAIPQLELQGPEDDVPSVDSEQIYVTLDCIKRRADCSDFGLHAVLRIRYRYPHVIEESLRIAIDETLKQAVYWFEDEATDMWFSTENHQVLYAVAELLAGELLSGQSFNVTGETGAWHRDRAAARLRRWIDWRARFGFSEWLSNQYYDEDVAALLNLAEYAPWTDLRQRASALVDVLCYELAVNSFEGHLLTTHGRAYADAIFDSSREPIAPLCYLGWGNGDPPNTLGLGAVLLASGAYRIPAAIRAIGRNQPAEFVHQERHGLNVEEAFEFEVDPTDPEDTLFFWGELVMGHAEVAETALQVCPTSYRRRYAEIEPAVRYHRFRAESANYTPDPNNTALTRADVTTFQTPDCVLSCAQEYRPGSFGFQQHIWQASLGGKALVFSNHPQGGPDAGMDTYWARNGILPRAASYRGVCIALYQIGQVPYATPNIPGFDSSLADYPYTHAYVPRFAFDDWVEQGKWICGRRGNGYVAVGTPQRATWRSPETDVCTLLGLDDPLPYDRVSEAKSVAWVCVVGRQETDGPFAAFVDAVTNGSLSGDAETVEYESPSVGPVSFGWDDPLVVDGREVSLTVESRYKGPYCHVPFGETAFTVETGSNRYRIDPEQRSTDLPE